MFVSEKARGEAQELFAKKLPCAPRITKLSEAIRVGAITIPENRTWSGCTLGTAYQAAAMIKITHNMALHEPETIGQMVMGYLGDRFKISRMDLAWLSRMHAGCNMTRADAIIWLERRGL